MGTQRTESKLALWHHPRGGWAKKIRGKVYYFGRDESAALAEYNRVQADLEAGRVPRPRDYDGITLAALCNSFLTAKRARVDSGELSSRMWAEYHRACEEIIDEFGKGRAVDDLRPEDFGALRARVAKRLGPVSIGKFIQLARTVFLYAFESELIDRPIRFGGQFDKPPRRVTRLERAKRSAKLIDPATARTLIDRADVQLKAMILLGLNCG